MGPTIGGALADKFGFDWAATGCAGLLTFSVSVLHSCIMKSFAYSYFFSFNTDMLCEKYV